jgi:outer membrane protein OmpA-like peptidoglycan-associated protein
MITDLRSIADKLKAWLGEHPTGKVLLEGFARDDEPGRNLQYEQAIAFRKAQIVRDHLVLFGVPAHRISIISFREEIPRWALNPDVINGVSLFAIRE